MSNTSDHLPISIHLKHHNACVFPQSEIPAQVAWNKVSSQELHELYTGPLEECMEIRLQEWENNKAHCNNITPAIDTLLSGIGEDMKACSQHLPQKKYKRFLKPYWNPELHLLSKKEKEIRYLWIKANRPRDPSNP